MPLLKTRSIELPVDTGYPDLTTIKKKQDKWTKTHRHRQQCAGY